MPEEKTVAKPLVRSEVSILSPLRYPGAKRRLAAYIGEVLKINSLRPELFVEPFAGGASVALQLLQSGLVENIALGEKDALVASFWKVVFSDANWLIDQIENIPVTLEKWYYFKQNSFRSNRERALACLFLNRTSFSGILARSTGPIGGHNQASEYKIDCRFPVATLSKRIRQAAALRDKVLFVETGDWRSTVKKVQKLGYKDGDVFYYFDPPFYAKADKLYRHFFGEQDHKELHDELVQIREPWLLSYDAAEWITNLYSHNGCGPKRIEYLYSIARADKLVTADELVITNLPILPEANRIWRSNAEWRRPVTSGKGGRDTTENISKQANPK